MPTFLQLLTSNMENLLIKVYKKPRLSAFLKMSSHIISAFFVLFFALILGVIIYSEIYIDALLVALTALVGYVALTLMRRLIDAPRPYELYGFYENKPKEKRGRSFPSRHAYSAFCIATLGFIISGILALIMLLLALLLCVSRVLLGIHFIRDVIAGALIGILSGALGISILYLF